MVCDEGSGNIRLLPQQKNTDAESDLEDESDSESESDEDEDENEKEKIKNSKKYQPNLKLSDNEVGGIISDLAKLVLKKPEPDSNSDADNQEVIMPDVSDKFPDLEIQLDGENGIKIPRYSCACHKANIAVNKTIKAHTKMQEDLRAIAKYTKKIRKSKQNKLFAIEKCRLHCANKTRWSSAFLN